MTCSQPCSHKQSGIEFIDDEGMISNLPIMTDPGCILLFTVNVSFGGIRIRENLVQIPVDKPAGLIQEQLPEPIVGLFCDSAEKAGNRRLRRNTGEISAEKRILSQNFLISLRKIPA